MYRKPRPLSPRESLHRQGYNFIAEDATAAVKPCLWCKRALRGGESCYKHQFYGIDTWRCVQMTPTLRCNQRCLFCWRSMEYEPVDERILSPDEIIAGIPALQRKGLSGDKPFCDEERWYTAVDNPTQYAVSLSGEPTLYPHLAELIGKLRANGCSVFVVSNGTVPEMIEKIRPTQMYISLDACTAEGYAELCRPAGDAELMWDNVMHSLSLFAKKEDEGVRTAVRITLVKDYNDSDPVGFAKIIEETAPLYVEIKGYMYLGFSRSRLPESAVPNMDEITAFAQGISDAAPHYVLYDTNAPSRVVCLKRK
ncbi:MAG TPA: 4-demethylwyosine synthase TYW1 [Methanocorpusculum sp.]|nr:4-demethylwyosine synthase TYW1 [Methanocorpusculum sp.]